MDKNGVVMYHDLLEQLKDFTDEQFGKFTRILIKYDKDGKIPEFDDLQLKLAFQMLKPNMDRNKEKYGITCERRRIAGALGGRQKAINLANASKCYQNLANVANLADNDNDNDNDNDIEKEKDNKEKESIKEKKKSVNDDMQAYLKTLFNRIWEFYPKKTGKEQARKTWIKKFKGLKTKEDINAKAIKIKQLLTAHIDVWSKETGKQGEVGRPTQFIPHFSSWLNDEIPDK